MGGSQNVHFVLVEPETAANVGAVCRALKNTGFSHLHLINPQCDIMSGEARALAHRSFDLIEQATLWNSVSELREHFDFLIATTADVRSTKKRYVKAPDLCGHISQLQSQSKVAVLFGRERNGLTTEEISLCDIVSSLPLASPSPAINLSQSVMLYSFLISQMEDKAPVQKRDDLVLHPDEHKVFTDHVHLFLSMLGLKKEDRAFREVESRLPLMMPRDKRLVMFLLTKLKKKTLELS